MNEEFTYKNPKWFYNIEETPELKVLETNFEIILNELNNLRYHSTDGYWLNAFPSYINNDSKNKWKVFTFQFFGIKHPLNCSICPQTFSILQNIPNLISAEFSYIPANTKILPHKGFSKMILRAHLGLVIPDNCGLRVGEQICSWNEGKMLIFDDSFEHEAWNNSNEDRFVLMIDIANPKWGYTSKEICKYKIETLKDEFILNIFPKEKWIGFLEKGEFDIYPIIK